VSASLPLPAFPATRNRRARLAAALAAVAVAVAGCSGGDPASLRVPDGTPVVLVSIDTLRADHLPLYGYRGVETPTLTRLAGEALLYEQAFSQTPLTLPSHGSILTGLLPAAHGLRDNVGYRLDAEAIERGDIPYLPHTLAKLGYATCAAVSSFVLDAKSGLGAGFGTYDDRIEYRTQLGLGGIQRLGPDTLAAALACLDGVGERPPFLFLHLYEPHSPYQPPEPFASRYPLAYDGEIAAADQIVGQLFDDLRQRKLYDKALIVVLSDHGEGLGDHGELEHGVLLHVESIHVPLLVKLPGGKLGGARVTAPASLTDVAPTVLRLLGQPAHPAMQGVSLLSLAGRQAPQRRIYSETFYPRLHFGWSDLASLIDARSHLIAGPKPELYDRVADPRETINVLERERRLYAEMSKELEAFDRSLEAPAEIDEETRRSMAALGYLGSVAVTSGPLPDPKSNLSVLSDLQEGYRLHAKKDYEGAARAVRRVLEKSPQMADAWELLGHALTRSGYKDEAIEAYRNALSASGGSGHVAAALASLYLELERLDDAEAHVPLVMAAQPSLAHGLLARIAFKRKDFAAAEKSARAALVASGDRIGPYIVLAEVLHGTGRLQEALAATNEAIRIYVGRKSPDTQLIVGLALLQGKIFADLGDFASAETAFRREIELFPDAPSAWSHLALLYALTGRDAEVGPTLRSMVSANGGPAGVAEAIRALRALGIQDEAARLLRNARERYPQNSEIAALR